MAQHHLTTTGPGGQAQVEAYLNELAQLLHGPRRHRTRILAELRDGLDQTLAAGHTTDGRAEELTVESAIAQFGTPQAVAAAFESELTTLSARRTIAWYIATGPLVGIWWLLLLQPHPWRVGLLGLLAAIPLLPLIAVAIAAATATFATTGRLIRWVPEASPRRACTAVMAIAALALMSDLAVITLYLPASADLRPLTILAIGCSAIRIGCSVATLLHATRRHRGSTPQATRVAPTGRRRHGDRR